MRNPKLSHSILIEVRWAWEGARTVQRTLDNAKLVVYQGKNARMERALSIGAKMEMVQVEFARQELRLGLSQTFL